MYVTESCKGEYSSFIDSRTDVAKTELIVFKTVINYQLPKQINTLSCLSKIN